MAEIQQWRRKIPTARSRTPLPDSLDPEIDSRPATALGTAPTQPPTPKRGLRPKLSSYLSHNGPFGSSAKPQEVELALEDTQLDFPSWPVREPFPIPNPERLIDSIMCRLLSSPYEPLEPRFNGILLQIFEAFRTLADERDQAQTHLAEEIAHRSSDKGIMQYAEAKWRDERQAYRAEVKRLELIIAKGKRGVADVALARQDSVIRNRRATASPEPENGGDGKETVLEFLEKTKRFEDPAWSGQRATMRPRPPSPSAKLVRLSRKLTKKASSTSMRAALPFGSNPLDIPSAPAFSSVSEVHPNARRHAKGSHRRPQAEADQSTSFSDDTNSTFSCAGDLLPDEIDEQSTPEVGQLSHSARKDETDIHQMAIDVSRPRGVSEESVLPKIMQVFTSQDHTRDPTLHSGISATSSNAQGTHVMNRKPSHLMGFINKLRPQLALETASLPRRFSFEVGDDTVPLPRPHPSAMASRESLLRTSVSLPTLSSIATKPPPANLQDSASSTFTSPAKSTTTLNSRRPSRIPSPSYHGVLARPRAGGSRSSSIYSTYLTIWFDGDHQNGSAEFSSHDAARTQVVDHTNVLRSGAAAAAARAASNASSRSTLASQRKQWDLQPKILDRSMSVPQHLGPQAAIENRPLMLQKKQGDEEHSSVVET